MKSAYWLITAILAVNIVCSCSCGSKKADKNEVAPDSLENVNAFSAEALADIVEYQRQKDGVGTDYNPWATYGFQELIDADESQEQDFEYAEDELEAEQEYEEVDPDAEEFQDASDDYVGEPVVYYLGHNVNFNSKKNDVSAFTKKGNDAVGVIDRFDDQDSRIDMLIFDKKLYDDFKLKGDDAERYEKMEDGNLLSVADSTAVKDVEVLFKGASNGGYLISVQKKK